MRQLTRYTTIITIFLLIFCVTAQAADIIGTVYQLEGKCTITRDKQTLAAASGSPIHLDDKVATGLLAKLAIRFEDGTELMLDSQSSAIIDAYVYAGADSNLLFQFSTGTFRTITGEIVKRNPEGFNMQTPLTTLGIRGSDVYALIGMVGEEIGAMDLGPGHTLEISTPEQTVNISKPGLRSKISPTGVISPPSPIPPRILKQMKDLAAPPTAPKMSTKTNPPRVPTAATTTKIIVTPPPAPAPKPTRHPRVH